MLANTSSSLRKLATWSKRLLSAFGAVGLAVGLYACGGDPAPSSGTVPTLVVAENIVQPIVANNIALLEGMAFPLPAGAMAAVTPEQTTLSFSSIVGATLPAGATQAVVQLGSPTFSLEIGGATPRTVTGTVAFGSCILNFANGVTFTMNPCAFNVDAAGQKVGTETVANMSSEFTITRQDGTKISYKSAGKPITGFLITWEVDANGLSTFKLAYRAGACLNPGGCLPLGGRSLINLPNSTLFKISGSAVKVTTVSGGSS